MRRLLAAAAVALLAVPAAAQVTPGADCAALKNPGEAARCYDRLKAAAQAELDETERKLAAKLADPKAKAAYQAAAKAWAEYRDKECAFETGGAGGTGAPARLPGRRPDLRALNPADYAAAVKCRTSASAVMPIAAAASGRMIWVAACAPLSGPCQVSSSPSSQSPNRSCSPASSPASRPRREMRHSTAGSASATNRNRLTMTTASPA